MIDPDLKYCPKCKDEYRADITLCADCGITLLSGSEMLAATGKLDVIRNSRKGAIVPGDDIVPIHKGPLGELRPIEKELLAENIGVIISKDAGGCGCSGG